MIICNKVGFLHIPRTGGTSIRQVMFEQPSKTFALAPINKVLEDVRSPANIYNPHSSLSQFRELGFIRNLSIFTVVRNPWARYVSWWLYNEKESGARRSFDGFLDDILGENIPERDDNLKSNPATQSEYLDTQLTVYPLRFNKLDRDWKRYAEISGLEPLPLPKLNGTISSCRYEEHYHEESVDLVAHKEKKLIQTFGFKFGEDE